MSFKEWLPITARNRVALGLAVFSLVVFVTWNCLPHYQFASDTNPGIVATSLWPRWVNAVLSPDYYIMVFTNPDILGVLTIVAFIALIQNALVTLALVPFWKLLHASSYLRLPLAALNLLGGGVIVWHLFDLSLADERPYQFAMHRLMALGMFALSAALFVFKNELALRDEENVRQMTGKGGSA